MGVPDVVVDSVREHHAAERVVAVDEGADDVEDVVGHEALPHAVVVLELCPQRVQLRDGFRLLGAVLQRLGVLVELLLMVYVISRHD